jgi:hypothetical protein
LGRIAMQYWSRSEPIGRPTGPSPVPNQS